MSESEEEVSLTPSSGLERQPGEKVPTKVDSSNSLLEGEHLLSAAMEKNQEDHQGDTPQKPASPKSDHTPGSSSPLVQPFLEDQSSQAPPAGEAVHLDTSTTGRPPLLPRVSTATKGKVSHRRVFSAGVPKPVSIKHDRAISAGEYSAISAVTDPPFSPAPSSPNTSGYRDDSVKAKVALADLTTINPLETEAEVAILKAIEEKSHENENASSVLPSLPDDAVDLIQSMRTDAPSVGEGRPRLNTGASHRKKSQRILDTLVEEQGVAAESALDVHEKLFVLAGQIQHVQEEAIDLEEGQHVEDVLNTNEDIEDPITEADNLVQNANVLFRRSTLNIPADETNVESDEPGPAKKKGLFPFFRRGTKHPKKSDSNFADDVETGVQANGDGGRGEDGDDRTRPLSQGSPRWSPTSAGMRAARKARSNAVADMNYFRGFLRPRKQTITHYCKTVLLYIFLPTLIISFGLYYGGNPKTCRGDNCPSISWMLIFFLIRQVITFTLAKVLEIIIIDYLSLRNRLTVKVLGPRLTLLIVGAKGWPFILLMWAVLDFAILYGSGKFVNHWMYYQDAIPVFNANNPSGNVTTNDFYFTILIGAVIISCAYACKRLWMGVYLGRQKYRQYGKQLAAVMNDMLLISLLACLGQEIETEDSGYYGGGPKTEVIFKWKDANSDSEEEDSMKLSSVESSRQVSNGPGASGDSPSTKPPRPQQTRSKRFENSESSTAPPRDSPAKEAAKEATKDALLHSVNRSQKIRITKLLGEWQEPPRASTDELKEISLSAILQFRQALSYMDDDYPFSVLFGPARTRELCAESSQRLYERLLLETPDQADLPFSTIAQVATSKNGEINQHRLKRLHRLFPPSDSTTMELSLLDFVRSVDKVYKDLRLLRAAIANSSQLDLAFEKVFNFFYGIVVAFIVLPIAGYDPVALIVALSGLIVGFAFMIGSASSKYFEGVLFILLRRPYDIGDRINVSQPQNDTSRDGSPGWFVEGISLFTTTVRYATTNEVATYSNGSLASMRIINGARSPQAVCYINLKFGIDVDYAKIEVFGTTIEAFVKARSREWLALLAFRATRVEADLGFIEYVLVLQHVARWQDIGLILKSKAELASYCLEVSKKLEMRYQAPPLPVKLGLENARVANMVDEVLNSSSAEDGQFGAVPLGALGAYDTE